jgi:hypothetical protein
MEKTFLLTNEDIRDSRATRQPDTVIIASSMEPPRSVTFIEPTAPQALTGASMFGFPKRISAKAAAVFVRAQSRWSSQASCAQDVGFAPA